MSKFRKFVTFGPMLLLLLGVALSFADPQQFLTAVSAANSWILKHFSDAFNWASFAFVVTIAGVWFSKLGAMKIGVQTLNLFLANGIGLPLHCVQLLQSVFYFGQQQSRFIISISRHHCLASSPHRLPRKNLPCPRCLCTGPSHLMQSTAFPVSPSLWLITI